MLTKYTIDNMKDINNIGIIMFGLLGDILIRTPVIQAIKDIYPNAKITVITEPIGTTLLSYNNYVNDIITIQKNDKNKIQQNFEKFKGMLAVYSRHFDLLLNLYNGGSSHLLVRFSMAKYKLGFCNQKKSTYNVLNICDGDRLKEKQSLYSYMISIIEPLSQKKYSLKPIFHPTQSTYIKMKQLVENLDIDNHKLYILNLGASKKDKLLDMNKYLSIVEYIYRQYGFVPAIVLNPSQEYLQNDFIENYITPQGLPFIKLKMHSLEEIASLMTLTKFTITPDTGLMHLAMAMDVYTLAIFTYTHPMFVDIYSDKFIPLYEYFNKNIFYQHQNISKKSIENSILTLFQKITYK